MDSDPLHNLLSKVCSVWLSQIKRAKKVKEKQFDKTARRAWEFYGDSSHAFIFRDDEGSPRPGDHRNKLRRPDNIITVNLTSEFVRMFLPYLQFGVPHRQVTPRRPPLPPLMQQFAPQYESVRQQDQIASTLLSWHLNYTPDLFGLQDQSRLAVTEALVKGMGVVWHESQNQLVGSFYDTVDDLFMDADAEQMHHAGWIARRRRRPVHLVAEEYGIDVKLLRATMASEKEQAERDDEDYDYRSTQHDRDSGDVCEYYEIFSRVGLGGNFGEADPQLKRFTGGSLNRHVYLAILPGLPYPLNLPADQMIAGVMTEDDFKSRVSWPIAFYENFLNPWPCTCLCFYKHPRRVWPTSPLESSLPLQTFIDAAYSYILGRLDKTCRDLIFTTKALSQAVQNAIKNDGDQEVIKCEEVANDITKFVHVLQFPDMTMDLYKALEMSQEEFRRNTGLTELMYGSSTRQMRSSAEAQIKQQNMSVRPEDMAARVEQWHSDLATSEAIATRLHVSPQRFAMLAGEPVQGPIPGPLAMEWGELVNTTDPYLAASEFAYNIEVGSGRKKNAAQAIEDSHEAWQYIGPLAQNHYQMTGDPRLVNGLIQRWGEAMQIDYTPMLLAPLPQQPPQQ
jgi:hypothetical protein